MTENAKDSPKTRHQLTKSDIHQVLSNRRRQYTIQILKRSENPIAFRELAEQIATRETGHQPPPKNIQQSVYVSLTQTHIPELDEMVIVGFEWDEKIIWLGDNAQQVIQVMEIENRRVSGAHFLLISTIGLLAVGSAISVFSGTDQTNVFILASGPLILISLLSIYQAQREGWPTLKHIQGIRNRM